MNVSDRLHVSMNVGTKGISGMNVSDRLHVSMNVRIRRMLYTMLGSIS